jgi:hypothetical protein
MNRSNDNSNLSNLPVNTKRLYKICNKLMESIYTDIDTAGLKFYNSFFLFNIIENIDDEANNLLRQNFYREKLNMVDSILFTENLETMQLNLSKFSDSNLSMSMSRSFSNDRVGKGNDYTINDDVSVNLNLHNITSSPKKSKSRSKTKVIYANPPRINIKVKLKDIIKQDVIENSVLEKTYNLKNRKKDNMNITNISKVHDTSAIMNEEPSFVDIIDILSQTDLSYKAAIKQKKIEKANKVVASRARSPVYASNNVVVHSKSPLNYKSQKEAVSYASEFGIKKKK